MTSADHILCNNTATTTHTLKQHCNNNTHTATTLHCNNTALQHCTAKWLALITYTATTLQQQLTYCNNTATTTHTLQHHCNNNTHTETIPQQHTHCNNTATTTLHCNNTATTTHTLQQQHCTAEWLALITHTTITLQHQHTLCNYTATTTHTATTLQQHYTATTTLHCRMTSADSWLAYDSSHVPEIEWAANTTTHCKTLQHTATHTYAQNKRSPCSIQALMAGAELVHYFCKISVLQCVAVYCSVLQCVAVCCSVLQCVAVCYNAVQCDAVCCSV